MTNKITLIVEDELTAKTICLNDLISAQGLIPCQ